MSGWMPCLLLLVVHGNCREPDLDKTGTLQSHRRRPPRLPPRALNYADLTSSASHPEQRIPADIGITKTSA